jgi:hypothetical protein
VQFTLVFESGEQGEEVLWLRFHPCPVWTRGRREVVTPDRSSPRYAAGMVGALFRALGRRPGGGRVAGVAHRAGHGRGEDLEALLFDLQAEGFEPVAVHL